MSCKSGSGKSGTGGECSGVSSIGGVERRGSSGRIFMSCRSSVGKSDTGVECSGGSSIGRVERRGSSGLDAVRCHGP